jgi:hypothetical protein
VPDVDRAIGVGQGRGDEDATHGGVQFGRGGVVLEFAKPRVAIWPLARENARSARCRAVIVARSRRGGESGAVRAGAGVV